MVEQKVNIKVLQDVLGHKDIKTTLDIYTDVTNDLKKQEFQRIIQGENLEGDKPPNHENQQI